MQAENTRHEFINRINVISQEIDNPKKFITDQLRGIKKNGIEWILLRLASPFLHIARKDPYKKIRITSVAQALSNYFEANQCHLDQELIGKINEMIIEKLKTRTANKKTSVSKYEETLQAVSDKLNSLISISIPTPSQPISSPWKWPSDLNIIKISPAEKDVIDDFLTNHVAQIRLKNISKKRIIKLDNGTTGFKLPITTFLIYEKSELKHAILILDKSRFSVIGVGGSRKVKACYDLVTGEFLARKEAFRDEIELLKLLNGSGSKGIPCFIGERCVKKIKSDPLKVSIMPKKVRSEPLTKKEKEKVESEPLYSETTQIIEKCYDGSLQALLNANQLNTVHSKIKAMDGFLAGISVLHDTQFPFAFEDIEEESQIISTRYFQVPSMHLDIKPENILFKRLPDDSYETVISDFGIANRVEDVCGTPGFRAPELVKLYNDLYCDTIPFEYKQKANPWIANRIIKHNIQYGQAADAWSAGLVLAAILKNQIEGFYCPLDCISDRIEPLKKDKSIDYKISKLNQEDIDTDITQEAQKISNSNLDPKDKEILVNLWRIVLNMLRIDPKERLSIDNARQLIVKITAEPSSI